MSLIIPEDYEALRRQRDRELKSLEKEMEEGADEMMRAFLARILKELRPALTASATNPLPMMTTQLFSLGKAHEWWDEEIGPFAASRVSFAYSAGRRGVSDVGVTRGSLDAMGEYLSQVTDRLSRTAQPTIPEQAFQAVREGIADELARGSSTREMSRRIASDLSWTGPDRGLWEGRLSQADQAIDRILDQIGPPGNPTREAMRRNDPQIRELQAQRSAAIGQLDRDQSAWQTRAERIARTETTAAYNAGAQQAFIEEGAGAKMWIATADDRTRDSHLEASGECVPASGTFQIGGADLVMPGDPSGPPEETINCRCTMIAGPSCDDLEGIARQANEAMDREREERGLPTDPEQGPYGLERPEQSFEANPLDLTPDVETIPGRREFDEPTHRQIDNFSAEELQQISDLTEAKKQELAESLAGVDQTGARYQDLQSDHMIKYGNEHLGSIYELQGFNGLPTMVDNLDAVPGGPTIHRGISSVASTSGTVDGTVLAESFKSGPTHWPGLGALGSGSYASTEVSTALKYSIGHSGTSRTSVGGPGGDVINMKLKPGARVIDAEAAKRAMRADIDRLAQEAQASGSREATLRAQSVGPSPFAMLPGISDAGEWAALNGYDAMAQSLSNGERYFVILNRGAVYVQK